jgi:hypothetical protein
MELAYVGILRHKIIVQSEARHFKETSNNKMAIIAMV